MDPLHTLLWSGIGYIAGTLSVTSLVIFIVKLFTINKNADNLKTISIKTYKIYVLSCVIWILWASFSWAYDPDMWVKNLLVIIPNAVSAILACCILIFKILGDRRAKREIIK